MITAFSGTATRLINTLQEGALPCRDYITPVIRWSDSEIFSDYHAGVYTVPDAIVTNAFTILSRSRRELYLDSTYEYADHYFSLPYTVHHNTFHYHGEPDPLDIKGPAIIIGGSPENGNWLHWNLNWATRLSMMAKIAPDLLANDSVSLIFHNHVQRKPFCEYLALYGIDLARCHFTSLDRDIVCSELYVPTFVSQMLYAKEFICDLSQRCLKHAHEPSNNNTFVSENVFISRQTFPTPRRRISNFESIEPILSRLNYNIFVADGLPLQTQVAAFRGAKTIVGAHGAGLASIIFAEPCADVIVLDSARNIREGHTRMFTVLAEMMGHRCFVLESNEQSIAPDAADSIIEHCRDLHVDANAFVALLERLEYAGAYRRSG
jgi:hypothetical protein